ncbi:hypothetical protein bas69_0024 [Escherichia phage AlfredRasser]|nr:hypothetical protein bas69_0024 [Escherichia phage AlfredRasser]
MVRIQHGSFPISSNIVLSTCALKTILVRQSNSC